jgi:hypothetical protein
VKLVIGMRVWAKNNPALGRVKLNDGGQSCEVCVGPRRLLKGRPGHVAEPLKIVTNVRSADHPLRGTNGDRRPATARRPSNPPSADCKLWKGCCALPNEGEV